MLPRLCCSWHGRRKPPRPSSTRSYGATTSAASVEDARPCSNIAASVEDARPCWNRGALEILEPIFISSDDTIGSSLSLDALASTLQRCAKFKALSAGRSCHDWICNLAYDPHPFLQSLLVQMYASADSLGDAMSVFVASHHHHQQSFIWNHILNALVLHHQYADALQIFERMWQQCTSPDKFTFITILAAFTSNEYLNKGKRLHAVVLTSGFHHNVVLATAFITMYQKCGSLDNAWITFEKILQPDEVSWTSIIAAYAQHGRSQQALHLFDLMLQEGFTPSKVAFACTIDACANCAALDEGNLLHACMIEHGIKADKILENAFIRLYGVCESKDDAQHVYDRMECRDIASFNSLILAYAQNGQAKEALHVFGQLLREGIVPSKATYASLLDACMNAMAETEIKKIHGCITDSGFDKDLVMETKLLKMYGKCGRLEEVYRLFEKMQERNVASWNTVIAAFARQGRSAEALYFFMQMQHEGAKPNKATCLCMLDACLGFSVLMKAKYGHVYVLNSGFESNIVVCNLLISTYGKCGSIENARKLFDKMPRHDLVSWTAMIAVYGQHNHGKEAIQAFGEMQQEVGANQVTYVCATDACATSAMLMEGKLIHFCAVCDGLETDNKVLNALVNMYGKCGSLEDALNMFISIPERSVILWTTLVGAYAHYGKFEEALQQFQNMQQEGMLPNKVTFISIFDIYDGEKLLVLCKQMHSQIIECGLASDVTVSNALIKMYGVCHSIENAVKVFEGMVIRDVVSWTAIIAVHAQHLKGKKALELFDQMQGKGFEPSEITFVCILDACASSSALATGECLHDRIVHDNLEWDVVIGTALVNMYGKCGQLYSARRVFDRMKMRNLLSWTAIIAIYAHHGDGKEALRLFEKMEEEGLRADNVALVSILAACSHSGLVNEGSLFFTKVLRSGNIHPSVEHYACMIDLLGRAGRSKEAELLLRDMPFEPTAVSLTSLLESCRQKGDLQGSAHAAMQVLNSDFKDSAPYVLLSNIYACVEREVDVDSVVRRESDKILWEEVAYCSNDVHDKVHEFLVEEHPL